MTTKTNKHEITFQREIEKLLQFYYMYFHGSSCLAINGITAPIEFNKVKNERYLKVIDRLKDIRNAQIAYKSVNGLYSDNFDSLVKFIDSAQFTIMKKEIQAICKR